MRVHFDIVPGWLSLNKLVCFEVKDENDPLIPADDRHRLSPFGRGEGEMFPAFSGVMTLTTHTIKQGERRDTPIL